MARLLGCCGLGFESKHSGKGRIKPGDLFAGCANSARADLQVAGGLLHRGERVRNIIQEHMERGFIFHEELSDFSDQLAVFMLCPVCFVKFTLYRAAHRAVFGGHDGGFVG